LKSLPANDASMPAGLGLGGIRSSDSTPSHRTISVSQIRTGNRSLVRTLGLFALPLVAPLALFLSVVSYGEALTRPYVVLGLLAFFVVFPGSWTTSVTAADSRRQVVIPWLVAVPVLALVGLVTQSTHFYTPEVLMTWVVMTPILQVVLLHLMPKAVALLVRMRRDKHRVVIVGANEVGIAFANAVNTNEMLHSEIVAFFDDRAPGRLRAVHNVSVAGPMSALADYARRFRVNQIYIALPLSSQPRIVAQLEALGDCTASIYFLPDLMSIDLIQPRLDTHAGFPVVSICDSPFNGVDGAIKRAFDLLLASTAVLLLAPLMALIAIAVKATSPGPVLFRQRRYGLDSSEIMVWKFRSMTVTEDGATNYTQVTRGDARLTRIGKFLRQTSLDELPQFFNVLQGKMSIVGPRPHAMMVNAQYRQQILGYMVRHKVRPGITGWAQVHGYRGGDDLNSMTKRIEYDLAYLRHWSLWMDVRILARTMLLVLKDSRAY